MYTVIFRFYIYLSVRLFWVFFIVFSRYKEIDQNAQKDQTKDHIDRNRLSVSPGGSDFFAVIGVLHHQRRRFFLLFFNLYSRIA